MRSSRIAAVAALTGARVMPVVSASSANAAPAASAVSAVALSCNDPGPWIVGTAAVRIHSRPSTSSTVVGVLYRSQKFTAHRVSGNWVYITDRSTGVTGWVSHTYVYRDVRFCLD
jgi:hypothetical protein